MKLEAYGTGRLSMTTARTFREDSGFTNSQFDAEYDAKGARRHSRGACWIAVSHCDIDGPKVKKA